MDESEQRPTRDAGSSTAAPLKSGRLDWPRARARGGREPAAARRRVRAAASPAMATAQAPSTRGHPSSQGRFRVRRKARGPVTEASVLAPARSPLSSSSYGLRLSDDRAAPSYLLR